MAKIFLSHTSIDKPFVEKLARDLERLGIKVWYDKYEIKVGQSIFWKIEEGISETDYFAIVIFKEAWQSDWVRAEFDAAWQKQMKNKRNIILPILYRDCEIPLMIRGIKYADFRKDENYYAALADLASAFGIKNVEVITEDNWRKFIKGKTRKWKDYCEIEYGKFVTAICKVAREFNMSTWVGGTQNPYSISVSAWVNGHHFEATIKMLPKDNYFYYAAANGSYNPNHVVLSNFDNFVGTTVNEAVEFIYTLAEDIVKKYGWPTGQAHHHTGKYLNKDKQVELVKDFIKNMNWDKGVL